MVKKMLNLNRIIIKRDSITIAINPINIAFVGGIAVFFFIYVPIVGIIAQLSIAAGITYGNYLYEKSNRS